MFSSKLCFYWGKTPLFIYFTVALVHFLFCRTCRVAELLVRDRPLLMSSAVCDLLENWRGRPGSTQGYPSCSTAGNQRGGHQLGAGGRVSGRINLMLGPSAHVVKMMDLKLLLKHNSCVKNRDNSKQIPKIQKNRPWKNVFRCKKKQPISGPDPFLHFVQHASLVP